jgi:hypothetical protein
VFHRNNQRHHVDVAPEHFGQFQFHQPPLLKSSTESSSTASIFYLGRKIEKLAGQVQRELQFAIALDIM